MVAALVVPLLLGFSLENSVVPRDEIARGGPPKDGIPALLAPKFVAADDAGFLDPGDLVVGFQSGDEARAYPLRILNWHEVVNDSVGGAAIAVTWCPLTATAVVFDREIPGATLTFGVSGLLYQSNVIVYDHQTDTLWSQLGESAIAGDHVGTSLVTLPAEVTTWSTWSRAHPRTKVLSADTGHRRDYSADPYATYHASPGLMFPPGHRDPRLRDKQRVFGLAVGDEAVAYPIDALPEQPVADDVGGRPVRVTHDATSGTTRAVDAASGRLLPGTAAYWFAWSAFHPRTRIWTPSGPPPEAP